MSISPWHFYTMMGYPLPEESEYFIYKNTEGEHKTKEKEYTQAMLNHIQMIKKYSRLRKNLPFIQAIYICDGMSFNAADKKSDIDLFFIVKHKSIRRARFWSVALFYLLGRKRSLKKKAGFFDLIFYVDEKKINLESLALQPEDIYLSYRLAHLVPLYQEKPNTYDIYKHNTWMQKTLPYFPMKHIIQLPMNEIHGKGRIKKSIEFLSGISPDNFREHLIQSRWKPLVIRKKKKHGKGGRGVVINNDMLKFHLDRRKEIQKKRDTDIYKQTDKTNNKRNN